MIYLYAFLLFYALWVFYLAVMNLKRANDTVGLSTPAKILGYPTLAIGLTLDLTANWTIFSLLFLEIPAKPLELVTGRLKRYNGGPDGWRKTFTRWFAKDLLDEFDPSGRHV